MADHSGNIELKYVRETPNYYVYKSVDSNVLQHIPKGFVSGQPTLQGYLNTDASQEAVYLGHNVAPGTQRILPNDEFFRLSAPTRWKVARQETLEHREKELERFDAIIDLLGAVLLNGDKKAAPKKKRRRVVKSMALPPASDRIVRRKRKYTKRSKYWKK